MRVLIAEDELLERKAMRKFIEDNFEELEIVGEAPNGRKAIELAGNSQPDIIFMDIKMPGINGLEAIEKIHQLNPATKFILVSAYDSFQYAKQAMTLGIKEYILKPGKKEEIVNAIIRVQKEILLERQERKDKAHSNHVMKEHLMMKLMKHPLESDALTIQKQFFPNMKSGYFLVVQTGTEASQHAVDHILHKAIKYPFIVYRNGDQLSVCVFTSIKVDKAEIVNVARKVHLELGDDSFVGSGYPCTSVEDFPISYKEAFTACYQLEKENNRNYGFVKKKESEADRNASISRLMEVMEKGNDEKVLRIYQEHIEQFGSSDLDDIYLDIKRMMLERDIVMPKMKISELETKQDWEKFLTVCCLQIQDYYQSKQYIEKAKSFIRQHYQDAITLEDTAAHVNLSPNYFSNMFKQEFGTTFIDYVTKVRLEKAKELIERNSYSLKEISFMVGYKDPNYFSRVFKKHFSESPKRFQQDILKK